MKIKTFLLTIVVIFSVFTTFSCSNNEIEDREYNETEVIEEAKKLIKKSEVLNDIYYGYGIECDTSDANNSNGYYFPADMLSLEKFGVETVEEIKTLTRECFTKAQSDYMIERCFSSIRDNTGDISFYARYYQEYDSLNTSEEKCIMVYTKYEPLLVDKIEYLYDTVRVTDVEGEIIKVSITVNATNSDGDSRTKDIEIDLIEEDNGFRIDSPTYARY